MAKEILIADSDSANQEEFKNIFEATDYDLVFSENEEQALLRLKLFKPNLIIVGMSLQEKSGLEVWKAVKANPESKHIPVVLLSNFFKEVSEEDRKRVQPDGIITQPFHEDEILNLVDRLIEGEEIRAGRGGIVGNEMEWKATGNFGKDDSHKKKEEVLVDQVEGMEDEEIIDLLDVVEEPESRMSINDFVGSGQEEPSTEITPLESWEKLIEEEKPADKKFKFAPDEKETEAKGLPLHLDEESRRKETPGKELIDKIGLEDILQKVEQLTPSIQKEWPAEERRRVPEERKEPPKTVVQATEEPPEKYEGLAEFEGALKNIVGAEPQEREATPFSVEETKKEGPKKHISKEGPKKHISTEMSLKRELEKLQKELPVSLFEGPEEEKVEVVEQPKEEELGIPGKLGEEELEIFEEIEIPEVEEEELRVIEKPKEERVEMFEQATTPEVIAPEEKREEVIPTVRKVELQIEEAISRGTHEMMEGFIQKLVPEMTQNIMNLTLERIERMVKEVVPELAEKMIQEEIKRLQKGEKD